MKQFIPVVMLLLFVISSSVFTVKGQLRPPVDTTTLAPPVDNPTVDRSREEIEIFDFFPEIIDADFPGGIKAWLQFIRKNLKYPMAAVEANIQGTVVVKFTVNPDGRVGDIKAMSGPKELQQAAMNVIKKSPLWNPAVQRGHRVKDYKTQPIVFKFKEK